MKIPFSKIGDQQEFNRFYEACLYNDETYGM